jgi:hypothetical protein
MWCCAAGEIFASLREYARHTQRGHALSDNVGFIVNLPHRNLTIPILCPIFTLIPACRSGNQ